jgi:hypothetical protein
MRHIAASLLIATVLGACGAASPRATRLEYTVTPHADLGGVSTLACGGGDSPDAWIPGTVDGRTLLATVTRVGGCLRFEVRWPADRSVVESRWFAVEREQVVAPVGLWLWRPTDLGPEASATLRVDASSGVRLVTPWPTTPDGAAFHLGRSTFARPNVVVFQRAEVIQLDTAFGPLRVAERAGFPTDLALTEARSTWLRAAADEVAGLYGHAPRRAVLVLLQPVPAEVAGDDPVPFGETQRGGGGTVSLHVSTSLNPESARTDWVAVHELVHLGVPVMTADDAWLYEGLASYYQNVLRARSGRLSVEAAWASLSDGFRRGASTRTRRSLWDESRDMRTTHAYWPVYWGGALWAMRADLALRKARPGHGGLDEVMRGWVEGLDTSRFDRALSLLAQADATLGVDVLAPLAEQMGRAPPCEGYEALGLEDFRGIVDGPIKAGPR